MKTQISLVVVMALALPLASYGANCNKGCSNSSVIKTYTTIKYGSDCPNRQYIAPIVAKPVPCESCTQRAELYKGVNDVEVSSLKSKNYASDKKRKFYLAHPFFQPLQFRVGSITDFSYNHAGYDMKFGGIGQSVYLSDRAGLFNGLDGGGKWNMNSFSIKEDLSFGITDRIALVGMLRYDMDNSKFEWSNGTDNSYSDNGLKLWGLGFQGRFVDTDDWIATGSFYYERQKDVANNFILELKAGYKVSRSTIYAIGRGWFVNFDGDSYGNYVKGKDNGYDNEIFFAYKTNKSNAVYGEFGLGDFSVLSEDWTFNIEGLFGHYDWHNQLSAKLAFGWQPNDWFALNLYGRAVLYDDAKNKTVDILYKRANMFSDNTQQLQINGFVPFGNAALSNYTEYSAGLQAIFMF